MSYKKDSSRRNYRGRGKKAAQHQNPNREEHASDTGLMRPISADAVAQDDIQHPAIALIHEF